MQKIVTFLWFDDKAEEAAKFYVSIFKNSKIGTIARYGEESAKASGRPAGSVMTVAFELDGQQFIALNGGPLFKFTEAISLMVNCESQKEVDEMWEKLTTGGEPSVCGWLNDKYGLSWQVVPAAMWKLISDPDPVKSERVMKAIMQMKKPDIAALERAHRGE